MPCLFLDVQDNSFSEAVSKSDNYLGPSSHRWHTRFYQSLLICTLYIPLKTLWIPPKNRY